MKTPLNWSHRNFRISAGRSITGMALGLALVAGAGSHTHAADDDILIGGSLCLTGIQAPLDEPGLRGAELAVKTINAKGGVLGKKLRFVNLDGKSDPVTVGSNAAQLVAEGVQYMIAPCDFDMGGPANREAQKAGIVGVSTCASSPLAGSVPLGDKQFTLSMWNTEMGAAAAEYAFSTKGWKKAYVVTDTFIDYTTSLSEYFIDHYKKLGGTVIAEDKYTQGAQDFFARRQPGPQHVLERHERIGGRGIRLPGPLRRRRQPPVRHQGTHCSRMRRIAFA